MPALPGKTALHKREAQPQFHCKTGEEQAIFHHLLHPVVHNQP
jgi:hypothetical protein